MMTRLSFIGRPLVCRLTSQRLRSCGYLSLIVQR
jgi:hypothetical protein